jgi:hypothetical protein
VIGVSALESVAKFTRLPLVGREIREQRKSLHRGQSFGEEI